MEWVVYCLVSLSEREFHYVGMTEDLARRLGEHNDGRVRTTAGKGPYRMIVLRRCGDRTEARRGEKYFKSGFGRRQVGRLLELEKQSGRVIVDAEAEGFVRNPKIIAGGG